MYHIVTKTKRDGKQIMFLDMDGEYRNITEARRKAYSKVKSMKKGNPRVYVVKDRPRTYGLGAEVVGIVELYSPDDITWMAWDGIFDYYSLNRDGTLGKKCPY